MMIFAIQAHSPMSFYIFDEIDFSLGQGELEEALQAHEGDEQKLADRSDKPQRLAHNRD